MYYLRPSRLLKLININLFQLEIALFRFLNSAISFSNCIPLVFFFCQIQNSFWNQWWHFFQTSSRFVAVTSRIISKLTNLLPSEFHKIYSQWGIKPQYDKHITISLWLKRSSHFNVQSFKCYFVSARNRDRW